MTRMATKMNKKAQTMLCLYYHPMNKKKNATKVNMKMIKTKLERTRHFKKNQITTYHFEEDVGEISRIG